MAKRSRVGRVSLLSALLVALSVAGLALLGGAYQWPHAEEDAVSLAGASSPVTVVAGGVQITLWASREVIRSGDIFEAWVRVTNVSRVSLNDLKLQSFASPGFVPIGTCWREGVPGCRGGMPGATQPVGLEPILTPGSTGMVFAELKSAGGRKDQLKATVAWTAGGKHQEAVAAIDPVKVVPHVRGWIVAIYSLLKDLGLPLLVGLLAFFFQRALQERSRVQTVRNVLLPIATANAVNYLLPVVSTIQSLRKFTPETLAASDIELKVANGQQSFFYFVFLLKRMRDLLLQGGAIFLQDLDSEAIVFECWAAVYFRAVASFGYLEISHALDLMTDHESFSQFMSQLPGLGELLGQPPASARLAAMRFRRRFLVAMAAGELNADLGILGVMHDILQIEVNRLFVGWYDEIEDPSAETRERWRAAVLSFGAAHPAYAGELTATLERYLAGF